MADTAPYRFLLSGSIFFAIAFLSVNRNILAPILLAEYPANTRPCTSAAAASAPDVSYARIQNHPAAKAELRDIRFGIDEVYTIVYTAYRGHQRRSKLI